nr:hypothetical protein [Tanacetum cinerariifolium]
MSTQTFAKTHNLVAILEKLAESIGFEQVIDFLKSKPIHYALTVNPTIYVSRVKQFWATEKVKKVNDQEQIQALVDKTKVIIMENSIRSNLHFDDIKGIACLLNEEIFEGLARMSAKTTAWNEFSSTMAYAIIYLADNQKFNFSKRIGAGLSRVTTPLFDSMMVQATADMGDTPSTKPKVVVQEQEMSTTIPAAATIVTTVILTPRAKGIIFHEQKQSQIPTVTLAKDKGKAKMVEPEVPIKRKEQIRIDEEYARKLEAKEQEAARLSRAQQDKEANNSWDNMQAMMDADRLLAEKL